MTLRDWATRQTDLASCEESAEKKEGNDLPEMHKRTQPLAQCFPHVSLGAR